MSFPIEARVTIDKELAGDIARQPFNLPSNLKILCETYRLQILGIDLIFDGELDWRGLFFSRKVGHRLHIFSGGRFGYAGFSPVCGRLSLDIYLDAIDSSLSKLTPATCSLTGSFLGEQSELNKAEGWYPKEICYLVADVKESVDESGLIFRKAKIRSNLSRNLKKAQDRNFHCRMSTNETDLKEWYTSCHLVRIEELGGSPWGYTLLKRFIKEGSGKLALVEGLNGKILGGCVILCSEDVLELFMMSTPTFQLTQGVNFVLTEFLYKFAYVSKNKYVNWQASNPPVGSLVEFKKSWNAQPKCFPIYSKIWDTKISKKYIEEHFKDCYVFPFDSILGGT